MHTSAFATTLRLSHAQEKQQCNDKSMQKAPLFIQAEQHEEDFIKNLAECLEHNNCAIHNNYQKARYNVLCSIHQLLTHHEDLRQDTNGICHADEKTEVKDMRKRLTKLLVDNQ